MALTSPYSDPDRWKHRRLRVLAVLADRFQLGWLESLLGTTVLGAAVRIEECRSPVEALERAEECAFDVCFLDDRFGERALLRFLHTLRAWSQPFPTLLLVGAGNEGEVAKALQAGAADYLVRHQSTRPMVLRALRHVQERHRLERERRGWEQRYRALFERGLAGSYQISADGTVLHCNHAMVNLLGYGAKEDVLGRPLLHTEPPDHADPQPIKRSEPRRSFLGREVCLQRADGSSIWVRMSDTLVGQDDDGLQVYEGTMLDVTQAKQLEDQLLQREAQYLALFDAIAEGMLVLDAESRVTACNRRAEILLGLEIQELLGRPFGDCFSEVWAEDHRRLEADELGPAHTLRTGEPVSGRVVGFKRADGHEGWASLRTTAVQVPGHRQTGTVIVTLTDLTQVKALEQQLVHAQRMEVVGRMAGGMAHEFRNLLTAISGYGELLMSEGELTAHARLSTEEIRRAAERASSLAGQMLNFARRDQHLVQRFALDEILNNLQGMLKRLLGSAIELQLELGSENLEVSGDPGQFEQVVLNLVFNARDAMPDGGRLRLRTEPLDLHSPAVNEELELGPGRYVLLTVEDDGHGMDEPTRRQVFEPFFTTKGPDKGTGLGLPMVRDIVRGAGGDIWIRSQSGKGTTARIFLPSELHGQRVN